MKHYAELAAAAERALLGACIVSEQAYRDAAEILDADDLRNPMHGDLWHALTAAWQSNDERVDPITLAARCPHIAPEAIVALLADTPSTSNARRYAEQVADYALRSRIIERSHEAAQAAETAATALDALSRARELLRDVRTPTGPSVADMDVHEFLELDIPPYDWLVPGFLERGDRLLITGGEGSGKSVWARQTAVQVAAGVHPWKPSAIVPARNAAIIDLENSPRQVSRALKKLREAAGDRIAPGRLRIAIQPAGINLTQRADRRWLMERCKVNGTELLVIGPVYRLMSGVAARGDSGQEDMTRQVTAAIDEVRAELGITVIMEAHAPHASGVSGHRDLRPANSSVWMRWPEFGIGLRHDTANLWHVEHWRGKRDGDRQFPERIARGAGPWPWTPMMPSDFRIPPMQSAA